MSKWNRYDRKKTNNRTGGDRARRAELKRKSKKYKDTKSHGQRRTGDQGGKTGRR